MLGDNAQQAINRVSSVAVVEWYPTQGWIMTLTLENPIGTRRRIVPHPKPPQSLAETGLDVEFLADLLVKTIYRLNLERPSEMSGALKLPVPLIEQLIVRISEKKLLETKGQQGANLIAEMRYALTTRGRQPSRRRCGPEGSGRS